MPIKTMNKKKDTKNNLIIKNPHVVEMGIFHLNGILGIKFFSLNRYYKQTLDFDI